MKNPSDGDLGKKLALLRDRERADRILSGIRKGVENVGRELKFMHVCGTHQDTLVRYGLDVLLENVGVRVIQGPGCPVCVTTTGEIEEALALARAGVTVAIYGDMLKVPGASGSLLRVRGEGGDVRVVYSVEDALKIARDDSSKEVVFMGVGFETTAPTTAATILSEPPENFSVVSCHRTVPEALRFIAESGEVKLDGVIEPGHVSVIIGTRPYRFLSEEYRLPQVVAGFEPLDLLSGVYMLVRQVVEGRAEVENEYTRAVREEGNVIAQEMMKEVFRPVDVKWRGFPTIPSSGLEIKDGYEMWNGRKKYEDILEPVREREYPDPPGCRCGDVLRGVLEPHECPLFAKICRPDNPVGPCMVSFEGGCAIEYKYGRWKMRN